MTADAEVLIIGAGMTGALAAKTLHEAGHEDFLLLEAATRVGGRMWNVPFGGQTIELGASFFHGINGNPVFERAEELDFEYKLTNIVDFSARDEEGNNVTPQLMATYLQFLSIANNVADYAFMLQCEEEDKADTSVRRALFQHGWDPKTDIEKAVEFVGLEVHHSDYLEDASTRFWVSWAGEDFGYVDYTVTDERGYAFLAESFLDDVLEEDDPRLQLGVRVVSVSQNDTHVTVETSNGELYTGDYLLSTVSLGVLQHGEITWEPSFTQEKFEAIMQHRLATFNPVFLKFSEDQPAFWDDSEFLIFAGKRRRHWTMYQNFDKVHNGSRILQAFIVGEEAKRIETLSNSEVQAEIMVVLRKMYGPDTPEPESILVPRWNALQTFRGSFSDWPTSYDSNMLKELRAPHGRVHFAGEVFSSRYNGYVQGAYFEGIRGAEFLMGCMEGGECEMEVPYECDRNSTMV